MKFFVRTYGCQMNVADSNEMGRHLEARGIAQTDMDVAPSDKERVAIINEAARELVKRIPKK